MKPYVKKKLIEALKSGKYKKGTSYLYKDDCYCILGVLADICPIRGKWHIYKNIREKPFVLYERDRDCWYKIITIKYYSALPKRIKKWADISNLDELSLYNRNDLKPRERSWKRMIKIIEKEF